MGTRADYYLGRGPKATWLGSTAFDGWPWGTPKPLIGVKTRRTYLKRLGQIASGKPDSFTHPEMGWPWPWDNSQTTDFAYAFDGGVVYMSHFGSEWAVATAEKPGEDYAWPPKGDPASMLPDMAGIKNVVLGGPRSGMIMVGYTKTGKKVIR
jgi:hypothetical protein